jgi:H+/Cl- antiporter ClcA
VKFTKNTIWIIGLAIFLGAMLFLSNIMVALFAPLITMFGMFGIIMVLIMAFLGAWIMKKGSKAA